MKFDRNSTGMGIEFEKMKLRSTNKPSQEHNEIIPGNGLYRAFVETTASKFTIELIALTKSGPSISQPFVIEVKPPPAKGAPSEESEESRPRIAEKPFTVDLGNLLYCSVNSLQWC